MHQIVVIPSNSTANTALFYKTKERAEIALDNIHKMIKGSGVTDIIKQSDEFGVTLLMDKANLNYCLFIDMAEQQTLQAYVRMNNPMPVPATTPMEEPSETPDALADTGSEVIDSGEAQ